LDTPSATQAVLVGAFATIGSAAVAATLSFVLVMSFLSGPEFLLPPAILLILVFAVVIAVIALGAIGLPTTFLLRWTSSEHVAAYVLAGAIAGPLATPVVLGWTPELIPFGVFAGGVGGLVWWRSFRRHFQETGD
jgi:hypothetical protein